MAVTMTLGEFRERTKNLPDDAEIFIDEGDLGFHDATIRGVLPASALGHPAAIWLDMGQEWNHERDIDDRLDAFLGNY